MVLQLADRIVRSSLKDVGLLESRSMLLASPPVLDLTDGSGRAMRILLRTLVEELERPGSELAECSYALEHLTRAIIGLLIEPLRAETPAEASGLEAVVEFVRAHIERPMTLDDLARAGGLSRRQLQRAFNRRHEMSPLEYVRRLRLQKARELLLDSRTRATVAFVAQRTGFKHMGRFAREYRARISANGRPRRSRELCRRGQAP
jgi:transcriptional regulator GlxA family with amidase domain